MRSPLGTACRTATLLSGASWTQRTACADAKQTMIWPPRPTQLPNRWTPQQPQRPCRGRQEEQREGGSAGSPDTCLGAAHAPQCLPTYMPQSVLAGACKPAWPRSLGGLTAAGQRAAAHGAATVRRKKCVAGRDGAKKLGWAACVGV